MQITCLENSVKGQLCWSLTSNKGVGTSTGANDIGMGLHDIARAGTSWFSRSMIQSAHLRWRGSWTRWIGQRNCREKATDGDLTVHIWLTLQFVLGQAAPYLVLVDILFAERITLKIADLDLETMRPVFVAICPNSMFNNAEGRTERIARELESGLKAQNILVPTAPHMWRGMYSQFGHQFRTLRRKSAQRPARVLNG